MSVIPWKFAVGPGPSGGGRRRKGDGVLVSSFLRAVRVRFCRLRRVVRAAFVLATVFAAAPRVVGTALDGGVRDKTDRVVYYEDGRPVYCRDVIGMTYAEAMVHVEQCRKFMLPGSFDAHAVRRFMNQVPNFDYFASVSGVKWIPGGELLQSYLNYFLETSAALAVQKAIAKEFLKRYQYRDVDLDKEVRDLYAPSFRLFRKNIDVLVEYLRSEGASKAYFEWLSKRFAWSHTRRRYSREELERWIMRRREERKSLTPLLPYALLEKNCVFAECSEYSPDHWFSMFLSTKLLIQRVYDVYMRNRKEFVNRYVKEKVYPQSRDRAEITVIGVRGISNLRAKDVLEKVLGTFCGPDGTFARSGWERFARLVRRMGVQLEWVNDRLHRQQLQDILGFEKGQIPFHRLVALPEGRKFGEGKAVLRGGYVFVVGWDWSSCREQVFQEYEAVQSAMYPILMDIAKNAHTRFRMGPGFHELRIEDCVRPLTAPSLYIEILTENGKCEPFRLNPNLRGKRFFALQKLPLSGTLDYLGFRSRPSRVIGQCIHDVAAVCGSPPASPPTVGFLESREFEQRTAEKHDQGLFRESRFSPFAVYDYEQRKIYVNLYKWTYPARSLTGADIPKEHMMLLFHELVHAWQYDHFPIESLERNGDRAIVRALLEGHARLCTEEFARRRGWLRMVRRFQAWYRRQCTRKQAGMVYGIAEDRSAGPEIYADGYEFLKACARQKISFADVLTTRLPTARELIFPEEYVLARTGKDQAVRSRARARKIPAESLSAIVRILSGTRAAKGDPPRISPLSVFAARSYLRSLRFPDARLRSLLARWRGGIDIQGGALKAWIAVFDESKGDSAPASLLRFQRDMHEVLLGGLMKGRKVTPPKEFANCADCWVSRDKEAFRKKGVPEAYRELKADTVYVSFAGKHLYVDASFRGVVSRPRLLGGGRQARRVIESFLQACRKADAECARFFKDESGDDEWD